MGNKNSILLGVDKDNNKIYSQSGDHQPPILLLAPHGSGKGVSFVIPNLLSFEGSSVVHDIKGENYILTKDYRSSIGHKIFLWTPLEKNHRYNPLDFLNLDPDYLINDIQKIADLLIAGDDSWSYQAKNLFLALALYLVVAKTKPCTIGEIARMVNDDLAAKLRVARTIEGLNPTALLIMQSFLRKEEKGQQATIRALHKYLELWLNPLIDYATSASDFDFREFTKNKTTLYVGIEPSDQLRLQPLMQFFYQHAFQRLMLPENNHSVCFFLDDFPSIGRMEKFVSFMPYFRGYKIRLFLIASGISEIEKIYGDELVDNCPIKIGFAAGGEDHYWSEIYNLEKDQQILSIIGEEPLISKKFLYYEDEEIKKRLS
jgi:type IV secretion system protein VirD4